MSDYDPRDYSQTGECETCYQPGNIHHIDGVWQCDHCLREERTWQASRHQTSSACGKGGR